MLISALKIPLLSIYALAGFFSCEAPKDTEIKLNFDVSEIALDNSKSSHFLKKLQKEFQLPHYSGRFPIVNGVTDSRLSINSSASFSSIINPIFNKSCMFVNEININIEYDPTVYILNKHHPKSCQYNITHEHELKHVKVYIDTINEFIPYIKEVAASTVSQWQEADAITLEESKKLQNKISEELNKNLKQAADSMTTAINLRQKSIDSIEEYKKLSTYCR